MTTGPRAMRSAPASGRRAADPLVADLSRPCSRCARFRATVSDDSGASAAGGRDSVRPTPTSCPAYVYYPRSSPILFRTWAVDPL